MCTYHTCIIICDIKRIHHDERFNYCGRGTAVLVDGGVPVGGGGWMDVILLLWTRAAPVHMPRLARPTTARPGLAGTMWRRNNHRRRRPCSYIILYYIIVHHLRVALRAMREYAHMSS